MSVLAKKLHTNDVEIQFGKKRPRIFVVPKEKASGLLMILREYEVENKPNDLMLAEDVFPDLLDDEKRPAVALRGARQKEGFTQVALAEQLGITQGDLSKMESADRPIGKKMARRLAELLHVDYRIFL